MTRPSQRVSSWRRILAVRFTAIPVLWFLSSLSVFAQSETVEYYATDAIGSIRVVFDANGNELARADYLPFGEELSSSEGLPAERFTGQARDAEAGLDYFNARMLQPRTARFAGVDPVPGVPADPQSWNRYGYALNNPLAFTDPTGLFSVDTNCRQSQGAYWCPGAIFVPDPVNPSSVDQVFSADAQGYQGGEAAAMAEMGYEGAVANQFEQRYEQSRQPAVVGETSGRVVSPEELSQSRPESCSGPGPGCRAVSLHPGQPPFYVPDNDFATAQKLQLLNAATGLIGVAGEFAGFSIHWYQYPGALGEGLVLKRFGQRIISLDWHNIIVNGKQRFLPHIDIPGVTKHWPWGK